MSEELTEDGHQMREVRAEHIVLCGELATYEPRVRQESLTFGEQTRRGELIGVIGREEALIRRAHGSDPRSLEIVARAIERGELEDETARETARRHDRA